MEEENLIIIIVDPDKIAGPNIMYFLLLKKFHSVIIIIITVLHHTAMPNGWCLENVAQLLINCGTDICKGVLGCKAVNGHVDELIVICFYLGNACALKDSPSDDSDDSMR